MSEDKEALLALLKSRFPYGHPSFLPMTLEELQLHNDKNHDYTKDGDPLGNFNRVSAILSLYPNLRASSPEVIALVYAFKQLDAAMWMLNQQYEGSVEDVDTRLRDVHVYLKIARILHKQGGSK